MARHRVVAVAMALLMTLAFGGAYPRQEPAVKDLPKAKTKTATKVDASTVLLHLKIVDAGGSVSLDAEKRVSKGTNGFDAMKGLVALKSKSFPGLGEFITGLCGVDAPDGKFWALYTDGKFSMIGISGITIDKEMLIEWNLQDQ